MFILFQTNILISGNVFKKPLQNYQTTAGTLPILTAAVARMLIAERAENCHAVCVISECQSPMCTCHWWGSLWISLMAFRVLIAGFCMEWVMNNYMSFPGLMRVPTLSLRHKQEIIMAGDSRNMS